MAATLEVSSVVVNGDGSVEFNSVEGDNMVFASLADAKFFAESVTNADVWRFAIGKWLSVEPNFANVNYLRNKAITVDPTNPTPVHIR